MDHLTLDNVKKLLGTSNIPGTSDELEVLVHWTHMLAEKRGEEYVRKNRKRLVNDWKNILEVGLSRV